MALHTMLILTPGSVPCYSKELVHTKATKRPKRKESKKNRVHRGTHFVSTREADGVRRRLGARATNDVDLGTLGVELSTGVVAGAVQGDHLSAEQILAGCDALGDLDLVLALAVDDLLGAPDAVAEAILLDLEPAAADSGVGGRVRHLLEVGQRRSLVRNVHDIGRA